MSSLSAFVRILSIWLWKTGTPNSASHERALKKMEEEVEYEVLDEVEALRAIYGDERISFHRGSGGSAATITASLDGLTTLKASSMTLTIRIPSSYPSTHPPKPVLRSDDFTAAQSDRLVDTMMCVQTASEGVVCIYDWIQAMICVLNEHPSNSAPGATEESPVDQGVPNEPTHEFRIFHGEPLTDRKSVFQAHLALITEAGDVEDVLSMLRASNKKVETASHNTLAYRVRGKNGVLQDADDDGEKGAGKVVLHVLQRVEAVNLVVIVSRWFGGIKLGPVRFRHIAKVSADVVEQFRGEIEFEDAG